MAGLSNEGLTIKRLPEIVDDLSLKAVSLFQDVAPPGDTVDTSAGTVLGRFIGLQAEPLSTLWEIVQQVYDAFNPSAASGIALDNIVEYGGLTRFEASPTTLYGFMSGNYSTVIPQGSVVSSSFTGNRFATASSLTLDNTSIAGCTLSVTSVSNSTAYTVQIVSGVRTISSTYTSDSSATLAGILTGLKAQIDSSAGSIVTTTIVDSLFLKITSNNLFNTMTTTLTGPLGYSKIYKSVVCVAQEDGPKEQNAYTVDTISTPVLGWDSVENVTAAEVGRNRETDSELRERFRLSKYVRGGNILDALYSDLLSIEGVESVSILNNDTNATDSNGLPAHSFMALVQGGLNADIASTIWKNKPVGITTHGSTTVDVTDIQGLTKTVNFQRPTPLLYYISLEITVDETFPPDGTDQIKTALVNYNNKTYKVGDDVIYSRLYTPINTITGFQVDSLTIGTSASPVGTSNITVDFDEVATLDPVRIDITVNTP